MSIYYVNTDGSGSGTGSETSPLKQVHEIKALTLGAGDRVRFNGGQSHLFTGSLVLTKTGSATQPIVFESYGTGKAFIYTTGNYNSIAITGSSYLTFQNLEMSSISGCTIFCATGFYTGLKLIDISTRSGGFFYRQNASQRFTDTEILGCNLSGLYNNAIDIKTGNLTIRKNTFSRCGMIETGTSTSDYQINYTTLEGCGIYATGNCTLDISENRFFENRHGVDVRGGSASVININRNYIRNLGTRLTGTASHFVGTRIGGVGYTAFFSNIMYLSGSVKHYGVHVDNTVSPGVYNNGLALATSYTGSVLVYNDSAVNGYVNNVLYLPISGALATWFVQVPGAYFYNIYDLSSDLAFRYLAVPSYLNWGTWAIIETLSALTGCGLMPGWFENYDNNQGISETSVCTGNAYLIAGILDYDGTPQRGTGLNIGPFIYPEVRVTKSANIGGYGRRGYTPN